MTKKPLQDNLGRIRGNIWMQVLIVLLVFIAFSYIMEIIFGVFSQLGDILILFFLAWLISFILSPITRSLERLGLSHRWAVNLVYLGLALVTLFIILLVTPIIDGQLAKLKADQNIYIQQVNTFFDWAQNEFNLYGIKQNDLAQIQTSVQSELQKFGATAITDSLQIIATIADLLLKAILVLLMSYYFMMDGTRLLDGIIDALPTNWRTEARLIKHEIDKNFGGYIRSQLIMAFLYGAFVAGIMFFFHLDFILVVSILSGFLLMIPVVGAYISFAPPIIIALVSHQDAALWVFLLLLVGHWVIINGLGPYLMSESVGIHPLLVFFGFFVGTRLGGIWGAVLVYRSLA